MELDDILNKCVFGRDTYQVKKSEEELRILAHSDFCSFVLNISNIFMDSEKDTKIRLFASLLLKNSIYKFEEDYQKWTNSENEFKLAIKNNILACFTSTSKEILNSACSTIACKIFFIFYILYFISYFYFFIFIF